jgi:pumilio RNA-binding family
LAQITSELKDHYLKCIEDQNGNHVIQKLINRLKQGENNGIYDVVLQNIIELSKHQYGCRVIQTLLNKCNEKQVEMIVKKIYNNVKDLCKDQYGNYFIQYILENEKGDFVEPIYKELEGSIYDFSIHKYASNVIEKALSHGNESQRKNIINEIIKQDDQMKECLISMVKDKFGNYVVQNLIKYSDKETRNNIINRLISNQSLKKKDGFSKHVINLIEKLNDENHGTNLGGEGGKGLNKKGTDEDYN